MYILNLLIKEIHPKFCNYAFSIKEGLLDQIKDNKSNNISCFESKYDELFNKYFNTVNIFNYNKICDKFVHDIYQLMPISSNIKKKIF